MMYEKMKPLIVALLVSLAAVFSLVMQPFVTRLKTAARETMALLVGAISLKCSQYFFLPSLFKFFTHKYFRTQNFSRVGTNASKKMPEEKRRVSKPPQPVLPTYSTAFSTL